MDSFRNQVIIITGASSGIGAELARQLAKQGTRLMLAARNEVNLKQVAEECRKLGGEAVYKLTDITRREACESLIQYTIDIFGKIDTLINNAGTSMWSPLSELQDISIINKIMEVNYLGSVYCTYYALRFLKQTQGRIVIVNSEAGKTGVPTRSGYCASKFALNGFFDALRIELAGSGVTITSAYPGFITTGLHERIPGPDGKPLGPNHPVNYNKAMSTPACATRIIRGAARRKREIKMSARLYFGLWMKLIVPGWVDAIAGRAVQTGK